MTTEDGPSPEHPEAPRQTLYHWSPGELTDHVLPADATGQRFWDPPDPQRWRSGRVWMFGTAGDAWSFGGAPGVVHAVHPCSDVERLDGSRLDHGSDGYDEGMPAQFHASWARIIARSHTWGDDPAVGGA